MLTNEYIVNKYWVEYCHKNDADLIRNAMVQFHIETESIITKLKSKYIQIRTEEKETEGIFDYRLSKSDIFNLSTSTVECSTYDQFLDVIINYLWEITEKNLGVIKELLKTEIQDDYTNAFNNLKTNILVVTNKDKVRELTTKN